MMKTLLLALGIVLIIEGLAPTLFPNKWRKYLLTLAQQPAAHIRNIGFFLLVLGIIVIFLAV